MDDAADDPRLLRLLDLAEQEFIRVACPCGRIVEYRAGVLQRLRRLSSAMLIYVHSDCAADIATAAAASGSPSLTAAEEATNSVPKRERAGGGRRRCSSGAKRPALALICEGWIMTKANDLLPRAGDRHTVVVADLRPELRH